MIGRRAVADLVFQPPPECPSCDGLGFKLHVAKPPTKCRPCRGTGLATPPTVTPAR